MVEIEVEVALPAKDGELPRPTAAGGGDEGPEERQMAPTGSRPSAPNGDSEELEAVESGTKNRATQADETRPAAYSDSEELVTAESDMETGAAKDKRCHASYSDSEELIPAATSRDERTRSRERRLSASSARWETATDSGPLATRGSQKTGGAGQYSSKPEWSSQLERWDAAAHKEEDCVLCR